MLIKLILLFYISSYLGDVAELENAQHLKNNIALSTTNNWQ